MYGLETIKISEIVTVSLTLFAVIDVLGSIPILLGIRNKMGNIHAGLATTVSGILILAFFFYGEQLLRFMGLDVPSFAIAGSIIIFFLAMEMVLGIEFFKADPNGGNNAKAGSVVPIAFPMIAGSGTLTTVMSLKAAYGDYNILIGILVNLLIVFLCLKSLGFLEKLLGPSGISVFRKFFGVILVAIAIKIFKENVVLMMKT